MHHISPNSSPKKTVSGDLTPRLPGVRVGPHLHYDQGISDGLRLLPGDVAVSSFSDLAAMIILRHQVVPVK